MTRGPIPSQARRARRSFWALVIVAVLAVGSLSAALTATPSPTAGLRVAASGLLVMVAIALATRVQAALVRADRRSHSSGPDAPTDPTPNPRDGQRS